MTDAGHMAQLKDLLAYYDSPAAASCPHTPANAATLRWALAELERLRAEVGVLKDHIRQSAEIKELAGDRRARETTS